MTNALFELFSGFDLAYGTDEGGCRWQPLTDELAERHLSGEEMIGVYPIVYDPYMNHGGPASFGTDRKYADMQPELWMCKWGAMDIDEGEDSVVLAQNAATILWAQDIRAWVERSRSKGCHVWVFAQEWVEAAIMRKALMAALQLTGAPYDAVFPKQDSLDGPPGNYMRLPYGGKRPAGRQEILDSDGDPLEYYDFVIAAEEQRTTLDLLRHAATYYKSPVSTQPDLPPARDYSKDPLMRVDGTRLRGLAKQMYENGPVPYYRSHGAGRGRHGFLNRFARAMLESGYSVLDVTSWTKDLDGRLGAWWDDGPKFTGRNDCDRQIERLIADARTRAG
jgi:hypothetical protein